MDRHDEKTRDEIAAGERWLAGFETPGASPELLERLKRAARDELRRRQAPDQGRRWAPWHGAAAAAAMILLSVTVGWYSTRLQPSPAGNGDGYELLAEEIEARLEVLAAADSEVSVLDGLTTEDGWSVSGATLYEALETAMASDWPDEMDDMGASIQNHFNGSHVEDV